MDSARPLILFGLEARRLRKSKDSFIAAKLTPSQYTFPKPRFRQRAGPDSRHGLPTGTAPITRRRDPLPRFLILPAAQ